MRKHRVRMIDVACCGRRVGELGAQSIRSPSKDVRERTSSGDSSDARCVCPNEGVDDDENINVHPRAEREKERERRMSERGLVVDRYAPRARGREGEE